MIDLSQLAKDAAAYTTGGGIVVSFKSNYLPEIPLFAGKSASDATKAGKGIGALLGFRGGIVIRTADGRTLHEIGNPEPLQHWRLAVGAVVLGFAAILIARGFRK